MVGARPSLAVLGGVHLSVLLAEYCAAYAVVLRRYPGTRVSLSASAKDQHAAAPDAAPVGLGEEPGVPVASEVSGSPVINWESGLFSAAVVEAPAGAGPGWMNDFANHLGKTKAEREPNSKIRIAATPSAALTATPAATLAATPELTKSRSAR